MNILYYSCHEVLEYDEMRMLTDLGHRVLSLGNFSNPEASGHLRRPLPQFFHEGDWRRLSQEGGLSSGFANEFDVAIVMHDADRVGEILSLRPDMPVIYRSIGQSTRETEAKLARFVDQIRIVRYSERERDCPGFQRTDAVIYFGKNLADFSKPWTGGSSILTFHNSWPLRDHYTAPCLRDYGSITKGRPSDLYGVGNMQVRQSRGAASPDAQLALLRGAALYLHVSVVPPSYTLSFVEAMATGTPVLAPTADFVMRTVDPAILEATSFSRERYEIEALLSADPALLYSSVAEARDKLHWLLDNPHYRHSASIDLRCKAAAIFDAERNGRQWETVLRATA